MAKHRDEFSQPAPQPIFLHYATPSPRAKWLWAVAGFGAAIIVGGVLSDLMYYFSLGPAKGDIVSILLLLHFLLVAGSLIVLIFTACALIWITRIRRMPEASIYAPVGFVYGMIPAAGFKASDLFPHVNFAGPVLFITIAIPICLPLATFLRHLIRRA